MLQEMGLLAVVGQDRSSVRTALSLSLSGLPSLLLSSPVRPSAPLPEMRLVLELVILRCFVVEITSQVSYAPSKSIVLIHLAFDAAWSSLFLTVRSLRAGLGIPAV